MKGLFRPRPKAPAQDTRLESWAAAGWYGKLPTLGDFASRRLDRAFIEPWDSWLADGLQAWRVADAAWLQPYLAGPSWRFVLAAGAVASASPAVAGVLVPSVDRVGRYFPLTVALPLSAPVPPLQPVLRWLHRLDDLAVDAMQDDWSVERFETELARLALPARQADAEAVPDWALPLAQAWATPALHRPGAATDRCWWWCADAFGEPQLFSCSQLPRGPAFAAWMAGHLDQLADSLPCRARRN